MQPPTDQRPSQQSTDHHQLPQTLFPSQMVSQQKSLFKLCDERLSFLADSGISDTEDEEKSSEKTSEPASAETNHKPDEAPESSTSVLPVTNTEPVQEPTEPCPADTTADEQAETDKMPQPDAEESSSADRAESKPDESGPESAVEETAKSEEQVVPPVEQTVEPSTPTEAVKSPNPETPTSDKKRPLEEDEDDEEPGAKLPRMHSPDKVISQLITFYKPLKPFCYRLLKRAINQK